MTDDTRLDALTRSYRDGLGTAPPALLEHAAVAHREHLAARRSLPARIALGLVAAVALGLALVTLADASHLGRDRAAIEAALACGWLLAARWPARYARGLLPVTAAAAVVLLLVSTTSQAPSNLLVELAHLTLLPAAFALWRLDPPEVGRRPGSARSLTSARGTG